MPAVEAKIVYETGKNAYKELQIIMLNYKPKMIIIHVHQDL